MPDYCKNCGAKLKEGANFCPDCGSKVEKADKIFCPDCGTQLTQDDDFCHECGSKMQSKSKKNLIIILVIAAAIIVACAVIFTGTSDIPLESEDFGGITMLVPSGSNFVETDSLPSYGSIGGYVQYSNDGDYSYDAYSVMFSTIEGGTPPEEVSFDHKEGDVVIYKDTSGENLFYMVRQVGDFRVCLIGGNEDVMVKMLDSVEVTSTYSV